MENCDLGFCGDWKGGVFSLGGPTVGHPQNKTIFPPKKFRSSKHEYSSEKLLANFSSRELNKYLTQKNIGAKKLIISIKNSSKGLFSILFMEGIYLRKIGNFN
jgi:hypothetical protein